MIHVVIFLPGIMGSVLSLGEEIIWPGSAGSLLFPYKKMAQLMRPDLVATDVFRKFGIFDVYESLLVDLGTCGFEENATPQNLYPLPYDWRKSNGEAAERLADLVEKVFTKQAGDVEITLLAHSMGGLVARYYLESGRFLNRPGFSCIRNLFTVGTPHRGATLALTAAVGQEKRLFLSASQVLQLASDPRYPALYELLPPEGEPFVWNDAPGSRYLPGNIYDPATATGAAGLGLIGANLAAAKSFRSGLDFQKRSGQVRYFSFYGTHQNTACYVHLRKLNASTRVRAVEVEEAGDGTVPVWSGQPNGIQSMPVPGEHTTLFRTDSFRSTIAELLGVPGRLAVRIATEVFVSPKVVEPDSPLNIVLVLPNGTTAIDGIIQLHRVEVAPDGVEVAETSFGDPTEIHYSGGSAERISLAITAPSIRGYYKLAFQGDAITTSSVEFIVQQ
jgi:phospholipase A1